MALSRRSFLRIVGSSAIIMPAQACAPAPDLAQAPWQQAGQYRDPIRHALSYAILAPNPHNRQPWMVRLLSPREAVLYCDPGRLLPDTDPFSRQIVIGLGCFLELFRIAATQIGHATRVDPFPEGHDAKKIDDRPVARLCMTKQAGSKTDPLFEQILRRRTNRYSYMESPPERKKLEALISSLSPGVSSDFMLDTARVAQMRALVTRAANIEFDTPGANAESVRLMRIGTREINAQPDGITLAGPLVESLHALGLLTRKALADPGSAMFRSGRRRYASAAASAKAYAWIATAANTRPDQLKAGGAYVRMNLQAGALGLAVQPLSQALQEYPQMAHMLKRVHALLSAKQGERIQMLARVGYARPVTPAPRWPLERSIIS